MVKHGQRNRRSRFWEYRRFIKLSKTHKIFGVGLKGAGISLIFLFIAYIIDRILDNANIMGYSVVIKSVGAGFIIVGLALHLWTAWTLRNWWIKDKLCIGGPFQYFRHPMYAAWITFISFGAAFFLNSWVYTIWAMSLHPVWHRLVVKEEQMMIELFANDYMDYTDRVGRFIPRIWARK